MTITGSNFIGSREVKTAHAKIFSATSASTGQPLDPPFSQAATTEIDAACELAHQAFLTMNSRAADSPGSPARKAAFLNAIASEFEAIGPALSERITAETGLPSGRNSGELARTIGQLKMFAKLVEEGWWVDARIEHADPDRKPPKPDIRRMLIPLGPVAVFGASNFPQAFSVAGGDTASALAAGCPVVIKAHPAHPGASELAFRALLAAAQKTNMPDGIVSMLNGVDPSVSIALVKNPRIAAVGFTGSLRAGRALMDAAAARSNPIPVYAEMGSINPLFILPAAMQERGAKIAEGLKNSITMGVGQFCTKPGVVAAIEGAGTKEFIEQLSGLLDGVPPGTMLTPNIARAFHDGHKRLTNTAGVRRISPSRPEAGPTQASPALFVTSAEKFLADHTLREELFGPATLIVLAKDAAEFQKIAEALDGQLTATVHYGGGAQGASSELPKFAPLITALQQKAGRLLFNNYPTGVEVNHAMQHGGPYPATSDARSTSVGTAAIQRFARPLAFQDAPEELLPEELRDNNPRYINRLVNGKWQ